MTYTSNATDPIDSLANGLKPLVADIEKGFKTTQNNYGRYMAIISQLSDGNKQSAKIIAIALIKAGGNKQGILSAMQILS